VRPFCLVRRPTLEEAIACVAEDALVAATPRTIRLRKKPQLPQAADE
jgi:predicted membrane GTPase involved in stress response